MEDTLKEILNALLRIEHQLHMQNIQGMVRVTDWIKPKTVHKHNETLSRLSDYVLDAMRDEVNDAAA